MFFHLKDVEVFIVTLMVLCMGSSITFAQERHYLVAGYKNALPNPAAITAAGGTWSGQIPSIGVALVKSSNSDFLTQVIKDKSVELAAPDIEAGIPEVDLTVEELDSSTAEEAPLSQSEDQAAVFGAAPNDPFYFLQWAHRPEVMGITSAQQRGDTGEGVTLAILGTGIDCTHPDLIRADGTPVVTVSKSFVPSTCALGESPPCFENPCDVGSGVIGDVNQTHETSVAGIIGAQCNNRIGICGIAPDVKIVNVKIFGKNEKRSAPLSRILQAFDWASSQEEVRIINMSHGVSCQEADSVCRDNLIHLLGTANRMLSLVHKRGVVLIASAGNEGRNVSDDGFFHWPATDSPHTLAVGATGVCRFADFFNGLISTVNFDNRMLYSNYGFDPDDHFLVMSGGPLNLQSGCTYPTPICKVGLTSLPCVLFDDIITLTRKDVGSGATRGYTLFSGTSAAAPHASGLAALLLSRMPDLSPGQLTEAMLGTGDLGIDLTVDIGEPGYDLFFGYGRGSAALIP